MGFVELETCGSNDIPSCSQSYKTSFVGNLDFPKIKKLKNVCSGVWACTKRWNHCYFQAKLYSKTVFQISSQKSFITLTTAGNHFSSDVWSNSLKTNKLSSSSLSSSLSSSYCFKTILTKKKQFSYCSIVYPPPSSHYPIIIVVVIIVIIAANINAASWKTHFSEFGKWWRTHCGSSDKRGLTGWDHRDGGQPYSDTTISMVAMDWGRGHSLTSQGEVSLYSWPPVWLVWIWQNK